MQPALNRPQADRSSSVIRPSTVIKQELFYFSGCVFGTAAAPPLYCQPQLTMCMQKKKNLLKYMRRTELNMRL